jgi:hypothetical protein
LALILVATVLLSTWASEYGLYGIFGSIAFSSIVAGALILMIRKATPHFEAESDINAGDHGTSPPTGGAGHQQPS